MFDASKMKGDRSEVYDYLKKNVKDQAFQDALFEWMVKTKCSWAKIAHTKDVIETLESGDNEEYEKFFNTLTAGGFDESKWAYLCDTAMASSDNETLRSALKEMIEVNIYALEKTIKIFWNLRKDKSIIKSKELSKHHEFLPCMFTALSMTRTPFSYGHMAQDEKNFKLILKTIFNFS